jgi:hypothetical protein
VPKSDIQAAVSLPPLTHNSMSDLQNATKPILIPLLHRQQITPERAAAAPACDVGSYDGDLRRVPPTSIRFDSGHRKALAVHQPDAARQYENLDWQLRSSGLGSRLGAQLPAHLPERRALSLDRQPGRNAAAEHSNKDLRRRQLYIHAFTCPFPEILNSTKLTEPVDRALVQIWPIRHRFIAWQAGRHASGAHLPLTRRERQSIRYLAVIERAL